MGKGDKKTKRGKIILGSSGVSRPKNKKKIVPGVVAQKEEKEPKPAKKAKEEITDEKPVKKTTKKTDETPTVE